MKIASIAISKKNGTRKVQVDEASLIQDYGLFRILGLRYCFDGRYEEALVACKKALDMQPDNVTTLRDLAVIYVGLGQEEEARAAAAQVLRLDPNFSVEHVAKLWPGLPAVRKRFVDALRKAGLK